MEPQSEKQGLHPKQPQLFISGTGIRMLFFLTTADVAAEVCPTTRASNQIRAAVKTIPPLTAW